MNRQLLSLIEAEYERYRALGEGAMRQLSAEELTTDTAGANSIAMIVWHIAEAASSNPVCPSVKSRLLDQ